MFGSDFVFSISRDQARTIRAPLLILAGNDVHHPNVTSRELVELAPNAELIERWKDPEAFPRALQRIREFLRAHTP
jgi:hypothetical protein